MAPELNNRETLPAVDRREAETLRAPAGLEARAITDAADKDMRGFHEGSAAIAEQLTRAGGETARGLEAFDAEAEQLLAQLRAEAAAIEDRPTVGPEAAQRQYPSEIPTVRPTDDVDTLRPNDPEYQFVSARTEPAPSMELPNLPDNSTGESNTLDPLDSRHAETEPASADAEALANYRRYTEHVQFPKSTGDAERIAAMLDESGEEGSLEFDPTAEAAPAEEEEPEYADGKEAESLRTRAGVVQRLLDGPMAGNAELQGELDAINRRLRPENRPTPKTMPAVAPPANSDRRPISVEDRTAESPKE